MSHRYHSGELEKVDCKIEMYELVFHRPLCELFVLQVKDLFLPDIYSGFRLKSGSQAGDSFLSIITSNMSSLGQFAAVQIH